MPHSLINVIIPTSNRPKFLNRLLGYLLMARLKSKIYVADGSDPDYKIINQQIIKKRSKNLNIEYKSYPPEINSNTRLCMVLENIPTKYVVVCADDDFIVPDSVMECVNFLESNLDYSLAHGRCAQLKFSQPDPEKDPITQCIPYPTNHLPEPEAAQRLRKHFVNYAPTFYSVHRLEVLQRSLNLQDENTDGHRFGELLASGVSVLQGKVHCLDRLSLVRQTHSSNNSQFVSSWGYLALRPDFYNKYSRFKNTLAIELYQNSHLSIDEALPKIEEAFLAFFSRAGLHMDAQRFHQEVISRDDDDAFISNIPSYPSADRNELQTISVLIGQHFSEADGEWEKSREEPE